MSLFNAPRAPASQRSPFEGPAAGNQYEGFGGGAVGSVGGMNYGNTPWWMLPAGTQRNPSFMPVAQQPAPAAAPAMPTAPRAPVGGGPQDFFAALAGLLSGNKMPGQGFSQGAGAPNAYARPQMMQMSPEVMARISGQGPLQAPSRMAAMPSAGARPYTGPVGISEKLRPTEKDPTPWTKTKGWQDPRGNPMARPTPAPTMMPAPGSGGPIDPLAMPKGNKFGGNPELSGGPATSRGQQTRRGTGEDVTLRGADGQRLKASGRRWNFNPISPRRSDYRGPGVEDFRAWARAAPGGNFM